MFAKTDEMSNMNFRFPAKNRVDIGLWNLVISKTYTRDYTL